jgi:hypothetical protein
MIRRLFVVALLAASAPASAELYCNNDQNQQVEWTLGEQVPYVDTNDVGFYCWANGQELTFIKSKFTNIRMSSYSLVFWVGDDATFIYDNLEDEYQVSQSPTGQTGH